MCRSAWGCKESDAARRVKSSSRTVRVSHLPRSWTPGAQGRVSTSSAGKLGGPSSVYPPHPPAVLFICTPYPQPPQPGRRSCPQWRVWYRKQRPERADTTEEFGDKGSGPGAHPRPPAARASLWLDRAAFRRRRGGSWTPVAL